MTFLLPLVTPRPSPGATGNKKYQEAFKLLTATNPAGIETAVQQYLDTLSQASQAVYIKEIQVFSSPAQGNNNNYHAAISYAVVAAPTTLPL